MTGSSGKSLHLKSPSNTYNKSSSSGSNDGGSGSGGRSLTQPAMHGLEDFDELIVRLANKDSTCYETLLKKVS